MSTHTTRRGRGTCEREGVSLLPSGLAGSGSQEEGASLTWTGGHTAGKGERERHYNKTHLSITDREERESETPKGAQLLALKGAKA